MSVDIELFVCLSSLGKLTMLKIVNNARVALHCVQIGLVKSLTMDDIENHLTEVTKTMFTIKYVSKHSKC